jgi:hypothetical protein
MSLTGHKLYDVHALMSPEMFRELHSLVAKEPVELAIELCKVSRDGYLRNSKYVGSLADGERIHRVDTEYGATYVRSRATATQLRRAFQR